MAESRKAKNEIAPASGKLARPIAEFIDLDLFIAALENQGEGPEATEVSHFFAENQYVRTIKVPAGRAIIGKKHKRKTLNVLLTGRMLVYTRESALPKCLNAGDWFESGQGVRKLLIALEDSSFSNVHVTSLTDVDEIEREFIEAETPEAMKADLIQVFNAKGAACLG